MAKTKVHGEYLKDSVVRFTAKAGENITKGQAVYISGISGEVSVVSLADANDTAKMPAFGLAEATVSTNEEVEVTSFGTLKGLDTSSFSLGDILYVDTTAGSLTNNPSGLEATKLQNIGIVQRVHASSGSIKVGGAGRTNAVPNLDDGDIFIGDSNNKAVSDSFTNVLNTEAGISVGGSGIDVTGTVTSDGLTVDGNVEIGSIETATNFPLIVKSGTNDHAIAIEEASGGETWQLGVNVNGDLGFYNSGATTSSVSFIDGAGQVLIGEDTGDAFNADAMLRLQRAGDRVFQSFKVDADQEASIFFGDVDDDIECGIVYQAANQNLILRTGNNNDAITIDNNQNVGIGGTPDTQLNIKNGDDAVVRIESTGSESGDDARLEIKTTNGTFTIQNDRSLGTSGALTFAGNTSDNLVIDHNDGTVGIGVSTPSGSGVLGTGHKLVTRANTNSGYVTTGGTGRLPAGLEIATQNTYQANDSLSGFAMQSNGAGGATLGGYIGFLPASTFGGGSIVIGATTGSNSHAERIRITNDGLTFNGDTAAANALDDYEEGTWTPTYSGNTGLSTVSGITSASGKYIKIGNLIHLQGEFTLNGSSGTTIGEGDSIRITGLPYYDGSGNMQSPGNVYTSKAFTNLGGFNGICYYYANAYFVIQFLGQGSTSWSGDENQQVRFEITFIDD